MGQTYVGGPRACIDTLVADSGLEVMRSDPQRPLVDEINREPTGPTTADPDHGFVAEHAPNADPL
ncbi:MAG: hypothetical protein ACRDQH_10740 [Pseudonocardiaceae bacterium]